MSIFGLNSCAHKKTKSIKLESLTFNNIYNYSDNSGKFSVKRSGKVQKNNFVFQKIIYQDDFSKYLERTRSISSITKNNIIPKISQFSVYLEGKEYASQFKINYKTKSIEVKTSVAFEKLPLVQNFTLANFERVCFFHLIPECLKASGMLESLIKQENPGEENNKPQLTLDAQNIQGEIGKSMGLNVLIESYPFTKLIYQDISNKWIEQATLSYEGFKDKEYTFSLEIFDQIISYKYDAQLNFIGLYWVSQSLNMSKQ